MSNRVRERRKIRSWQPYVFFIIELIILVEFSYLYISMMGTNLFGVENLGLYILVAVFLYFARNCFVRMHNVVKRNKNSAQYNALDSNKKKF